MNQHSENGAAADPRLVRALEEYLAALEEGRTPDRSDFEARYPELVADLAECLDGLEMMHAVTPTAREDGTPQAATLVGVPLGDYRILREVGRGGMGVVYEAEQLSLRRRVALKVLPFAATLDPKQRQRFHNEAQAAAHLHHPNIVPVYAVGCERGVHYYAMQFIDGQTVADLIGHRRRAAGLTAGELEETDFRAMADEAGAPVPALLAPAGPTDSTQPAAVFSTERPAQGPGFFRTVARFGVQAALALEYAHQTGVIHRDVKPANLLLDARGNVWVTDFGLAQVRGQPGLTATGDLLGTLRYMSPEQASARHGLVDHRSDVYALGATLYELLTLRPAVPGETRGEVLRHLLLEEPRPPRRLDPAVPPELETVVLKALAKDPEERYATAQDLADDLQRCLEDQPIRARPPGVVQRARRWLRRHRPLAIAAALTAAVLLGAVLFVTVAFALQKQQLAEQNALQNQELAEKKEKSRRETEKLLFDALVGRAGARRLAHEPGYRGKVWKDLLQAAALDFPGMDLEPIRKEALGCLGDSLGLEPVKPEAVTRASPPPAVESGSPWKTIQLGDCWADYAPRSDRVRFRRGGVSQVWAWAVSPLGGIHDLKFSADGDYLIAACDEGVVVWRCSDLKLHWESRRGTVHSVAVHSGGQLFATSGRQVDLWAVAFNRPLATLKSPDEVARVEFSADGNHLLAVVRDKVKAAWSVRGGPEKAFLDGHRGGVPGVAFSPDGRRLASGSKDRTVKLWDGDSGRLLHVCPGHGAPIEAVAFSPDGRLLASGDLNGRVRLWDPASGKALSLFDPATGQETDEIGAAAVPGRMWRLQFHPEGKWLAALGVWGLVVWKVSRDGNRIIAEQLATAEPADRSRQPNFFLDLVVHPAGEDLVILDQSGSVHTYRLESKGAGLEAKKTGVLPIQARILPRSLAFDVTGEHLLLVNAAGRLTVWDRRRQRPQPTEIQAVQLALGRDGRWLATPGPDHGAILVDMQSGQEVLALPPEESDIWAPAWSPDGTRLALGLSDGGLVVWDFEQVRARLGEFGIAVPSTRVDPDRARAPARSAP
jgi:serine/threonine protein kinase/WD40 repeat protein